MENIKELPLKSIALSHHEFIPVLEKYSLDFCCKGNKTLKDVCSEKKISIEVILDEFNQCKPEVKNQMPFMEMTAEQLVSYILIHHHFYVKNSIPTIQHHLQKVVTKHGETFPKMLDILSLFKRVSDELISHMEKEEKILFPAIKQLFTNNKNAETEKSVPKSIIDQISELKHEHETAGDLLNTIRTITNNYTAPLSACTTHRLSLEELKHFEENLHQHVHLENNVLFPKAAQFLEK